MAGYLEHLGRVLTEKGAWYKISLLAFFQAVMTVFNPQEMVHSFSAGFFNVPGLLLYILCVICGFGYLIAVYNNCMNTSKNVLPEIDFGAMVMNVFKYFPFGLIWMIYFMLFLLPLVVCIALATNETNIFILVVLGIVGVMAIFIPAWTFPAIMAIHVKDFSYNNVLNPMMPFAIFGRVAGSILAASIIVGILNFLLYGVLFGATLFVGLFGSGSESEAALPQATVAAFIVIVAVFLYVLNALSLAFCSRVCDITKRKLGDSIYLDYVAPEPSAYQRSVDDDFDRFLHNKEGEE